MSKSITDDGYVHPFYCARLGHEIFRHDPGPCEKQCKDCFEFDAKAWFDLEQKHPWLKKSTQQ